MSNEEKILQILETMQGDISDLKGGQARLEARQSKLEAGQTRLEADVSEMKSDIAFVKRTAVQMEQDHGNRLRALSEETGMIQEKLEKIDRKVSRHDLRLDSYEDKIELLNIK